MMAGFSTHLHLLIFLGIHTYFSHIFMLYFFTALLSYNLRPIKFTRFQCTD